MRGGKTNYWYTWGRGIGHSDNIGNSLQIYLVIQTFHIAGRPSRRKLKEGGGLAGVQLLERIYFLTPPPPLPGQDQKVKVGEEANNR